MKRIIAIIFFIVSTQAFPETIRLGVENLDYSPFYSSNGIQYTGYTRDLFDEFARDTGYTITFLPRKVNDLMDDFFQMKIDAKFPDNSFWHQNRRKTRDIYYSLVIMKTEIGVQSLQSNKDVAILGIVEGFTPWIILKKINTKEINLIKRTKMKTLIKMLYDGEIDGIYASEDVISYYDSKKKIVFNKNFRTITDKFHLSSIKNKKLIVAFDTWFIKNSKKVKQIRNKNGLK